MAHIKLQELIDTLAAKGCQPKPTKTGYSSFCPGHTDTRASLKIREMSNGKGIDIKCWAGKCTKESLLAILGITWEDLFYQPLSKPKINGNGKSNQSNVQYSDSQKPRKKKVPSLYIPSVDDMFSSKRVYKNLTEYAAFKGVDVQIFLDAGWSDCLWYGIPAIKIPTLKGNRYRLLNNGDNKFVCDEGTTICLYKLDECLELAANNKQGYILSNGEPSTVISQSRKLLTFSLCGGEKQDFDQESIKLLQNTNISNILIPADNDETGQHGAIRRAKTLEKAGFTVRIVKFQTDRKGYDLADFCKDNANLDNKELYQKLLELPTLDPHEKERVQQETKNLKQNLQTYTDNNNLGNFSNIFADYCTEINAAYRFVAQNYQDVRFCHPWKKWLFYDGKKWIEDNIGDLFRRGVNTALSILEQAKNMPSDTDEQKAAKDRMFAHAMTFQNKGKIKNMLEIAKNAQGIFILPDSFDSDDWTLNCQNGLLNLRTGELSAHSSKVYTTKITTTVYDPSATCPTWLKFLNRIMDNKPNLVKYLQKAIGHCLTGNTMEKALFFLYGALGDNGKSTFLETITSIMGSYALAKFPIQALLEDNQNSASNNPSPYIAQLFGVRFVSGSELSGSKKLNEEVIKDLTGGIDSICAKRLYENPFTFRATHKFFMFGNDKPYIARGSNAVWNRLKTIPFLVSIPKAEQDLDLPFKLLEEKAGILAWAVQGCLDWQIERLGMPEEIIAANEEYKDEMDTIGHFLTDECIIDKDYYCTVQNLYDTYKKWCEHSGHKATTKIKFNKDIKAHGYKIVPKTNNVQFWDGLMINTTKNSIVDFEKLKEIVLQKESAKSK